MHEAGVGDKEDEELAGLEIQVCLTRVGLNSLPVTPAGTSAASGARRVAAFGRNGASPADTRPKRLSWNVGSK